MDLNEIRLYIRRSVRRQIRETVRSSLVPPKDFTSFLRTVSDALYHSGAPSQMIQELDSESGEGVLFETLWSAWKNIDAEMAGVTHLTEQSQIWSDAAAVYVYDSIMEVAGNYSSDSTLRSHAPSRLARNVVDYIQTRKR